MPNTYYDKDKVRRMLGLADSTDDGVLDDFGISADRVVDNALYDVAAELPYASSDITDDVQLAANLYTCSLYNASVPPDNGKRFHAAYTEVIRGIVNRLKATAGNRNTFHSVPMSYKSSPLKDE